MTNRLNNILVDKIRCHIPQNVKPLPYLMNMLELSKESVYRRLRSEIHFTFEEACKLSNVLGFSIDEILAKNTENRVFFNLHTDNLTSASNAFKKMLKEYLTILDQMSGAQNMEIICSRNRFSIIQAIGHDYLFKFLYYKWMHQMHDVPLNFSLSNVVIPHDVIEICREIKDMQPALTNVTYIIDQSILVRIIGEIQYYSKRKLISESELALLTEELIDIVNLCEKHAKDGCNKFGVNSFYYLSSFDIESNMDYISYDDNFVSYYWVNAVNPFVISSPKVSSFQKKWLDSLKKYSVLITQSNELVQAEFFNKQRKYIENMSNVVYWNESLFCM